MHRGPRWLARTLLLVLVIGVAAIALYWRNTPTGSIKVPTSDSARFAGSPACAACHPTQYSQWLESNHRHAMEIPTAKSVLGDFNDAEFRYFDQKARFFKKGESFHVTTQNQQGKDETFTVAYTLGYRPLQQYLVDLGGGRIQALPFAWDNRDRKDGGQRWFHLYPGENVTPGNPLFWTRPLQNWNHMCGDCHTTGFTKNFSEGSGGFDSRWSEIGNGCESCHGAGSEHIEARQAAQVRPEADASIAVLRTPQSQIDQCGACHARRIRLHETRSSERMLETMLQTWRPQLPQDGLYFVDGQIREEVFEIGSFLQSKMAGKGVLCTDCHDPHTAHLKAEGNALCTQCHAVEKFDSTEHHAHPAGTPGAQCVQCHMPERIYMIVDSRRDHRFAIPRPDLSDTLGTPNPCVNCHRNRTNSWAAEAVRKWVMARNGGATYSPPPTLGTTAWQAIHEQTSAAETLRNFVSNSANPIVKAAALASVRTLTLESLSLAQAQLRATEPLVKMGAIQVIGTLPLPQRSPLLMDLLRDPSRAVRLETASSLAGVDKGALTTVQRESLDAAVTEYRQWLSRDGDRAEALASLAGLQAAEGDVASARSSFERALQRDETSLVALLNYADFHRAQGDDGAAERLLTRASALYPEAASVHHALGLLRVRQKQTDEAIPELARAAQLSPDNSNYAFVYAVGLYSTGQVTTALSVLDRARAQFPSNIQIQTALQAYCADQRDNGGQRGQFRRTPDDRTIASICSASIGAKR